MSSFRLASVWGHVNEETLSETYPLRVVPWAVSSCTNLV